MKGLFSLFSILFFISCNSKKVYKEISQTNKIDPDIVLINIGNSSRAEIADLLIQVGNSSPLLMGVDVVFPRNKQSLEDSILATAFQKAQNETLAWRLNSEGKEERSIEKFRKHASDEGYVDLDRVDGVASHFTPLKRLNGTTYESFALRIAKAWKPGVKFNVTIDKSIPILFQRTQEQYYYFVKEDLLNKNVSELLKDKIVLIGFLGPGNEDKQFTPIRDSKKRDGEPDTYGLVIQANAIRTLLEHQKEQ